MFLFRGITTYCMFHYSAPKQILHLCSFYKSDLIMLLTVSELRYKNSYLLIYPKKKMIFFKFF